MIGYQPTKVTPAIMQPIAAAAFPSIRIIPCVLFIGSTTNGILLRQVGFGVVVAGLERAHVELDRLLLLAQLLAERLLHLPHVDREQLREHAVVNHVAHEAAELRVGGDGGDELVEGNGIEDDVAAQLVELQRLVVDRRRAGRQREHVFLGRFRVHRHEEVDFLLAADVALGARADGVPGGQARDVRREHVLARHRHAHLEDRAQQHHVGGLAARSVDGGDLDGEIVDDALGARFGRGFLFGDVGHWHFSTLLRRILPGTGRRRWRSITVGRLTGCETRELYHSGFGDLARTRADTE